ncbi:MAG: cell wall hydrolase [Alphaproteobacteria bacterium]
MVDHHLALAQGAIAGSLALATLSLAGSTGAEPIDGMRLTRADLSGRHSALHLTQISTGLSSYAVFNADRLERGGQGWTPGGIEGWGVYNLDPPSLVRRQLSYDEARAFNELVLPSTSPIFPMRPFQLRSGNDDYTRALTCLTQAVYYEAGFESNDGQEAVAQVVLNRVQHPAYPKTVCGVVYQGSQLSTGCQFSFTCDGSLNRAPNDAAWQRSHVVAERALDGFVYAPVGTATHYHADYVFPYWAVTLVKLRQIGAHIFYRMTGPSGSAADFTGHYTGGEAVLTSAVLTGGDARTPDAPSVVIAPAVVLPPPPEPKLITMTVGGETKTYRVVTSDAPPPPLPETVALDLGSRKPPVQGPVAVGPTPAGPPIAGTLKMTQRFPTPEEIRDINEKIRQQQLKTAPPLPDRASPPKI